MFINYLNIYGYKIKIVSKKFNTDTLISDFQYFNSTKIANYDCLVKINFNSLRKDLEQNNIIRKFGF